MPQAETSRPPRAPNRSWFYLVFQRTDLAVWMESRVSGVEAAIALRRRRRLSRVRLLVGAIVQLAAPERTAAALQQQAAQFFDPLIPSIPRTQRDRFVDPP